MIMNKMMTCLSFRRVVLSNIVHISACAYVFNPLSHFSPDLSPTLSLPLSRSLSLTLSHTHTSISTFSSRLTANTPHTSVIYRRMKTAKGGKEYERVGERDLSINIKLFNHVIIGKLNTEVLIFSCPHSSCTAVQCNLEGSQQVTV